MKRLVVGIILCALLTVPALGNPETLGTISVTGSGKAGGTLVFTVKVPKANQNQIAFFGISPGLGQVKFGEWLTMDLMWPILAAGMGSLKDGSASHNVKVPVDWPSNVVFTWYAQGVIVTPAGGGYIADTTKPVPFFIGK
jgi:hypothetical protein